MPLVEAPTRSTTTEEGEPGIYRWPPPGNQQVGWPTPSPVLAPTVQAEWQCWGRTGVSSLAPRHSGTNPGFPWGLMVVL